MFLQIFVVTDYCRRIILDLSEEKPSLVNTRLKNCFGRRTVDARRGCSCQVEHARCEAGTYFMRRIISAE